MDTTAGAELAEHHGVVALAVYQVARDIRLRHHVTEGDVAYLADLLEQWFAHQDMVVWYKACP